MHFLDATTMGAAGLKRTAFKYLAYYEASIEHWWDAFGPMDYLVVLCATFLLGWVLLSGTSRRK